LKERLVSSGEGKDRGIRMKVERRPETESHQIELQTVPDT
jgi:hypothetical protein